MVPLSIAVLAGLVWLGIRRGLLAPGSLALGALVGLALAGTSMGAPIGEGVRAAASAVGTSVQAGFSAVIK